MIRFVFLEHSFGCNMKNRSDEGPFLGQCDHGGGSSMNPGGSDRGQN